MVLRVAPPLAIEKEQMDAFVAAIRSVVELANSPGSFWSAALGLARRRAFGNWHRLVRGPFPSGTFSSGRDDKFMNLDSKIALGCRIPCLSFLTLVIQSFDDWVTNRQSSLGTIVHRHEVQAGTTRYQRAAI